jgi:hypothetical protein
MPPIPPAAASRERGVRHARRGYAARMANAKKQTKKFMKRTKKALRGLRKDVDKLARR